MLFRSWLDMKAEMERLQLPLYTMESKDPLTAFDAVGFTLQYELSYTNILAMLDLAGIPFYAKDRDDRWPLIVAGGPCACNAEPIADFFDVIQLGEGENQLPAICAEIETTATDNSGKAKYAVPGEDGTGALKNSALEMSNVDLSQEFSDMIVTQRGFQANSRLITVSDTMLEELINLKR